MAFRGACRNNGAYLAAMAWILSSLGGKFEVLADVVKALADEIGILEDIVGMLEEELGNENEVLENATRGWTWTIWGWK